MLLLSECAARVSECVERVLRVGRARAQRGDEPGRDENENAQEHFMNSVNRYPIWEAWRGPILSTRLHERRHP